MPDSDAAEINALATELESQYSNQRNLDNLVLSQLLQTHVIEVPKDPKKPQPSGPKSIGSGFAARIVNEDVSFLSAEPFLRLNAPKQEQEQKAQDLEAALAGIWAMSQGDQQVWIQAIKDLSLFGRCWWNVYPNPKMWAGADFDQGDDEEEDEYVDRVEAMKRDRFPIVWRYVEARNTWCTWKGNGELDQVVEIRSMTKRQIEQAYGPGYVTEDNKHRYGYRDTIRVIEFADDDVCKTVVCSAYPQIAAHYEHGLGVNPYVLAQMPTPPPNDHGYYWTGATFDLRYAIEEVDGRLADINWNIRRVTRGGYVVSIDPELRAADVETSGNPDPIQVYPDGTTTIWKGEEIKQLAPAQVNADTYRFIEMVTGFARESHMRPILAGALQSGTSGVLYNTAVQLAEKDFGPTLDSLKHAAEGIGKRFLRSVRVITQESGDTIPIYRAVNGKSYRLEIGAKDVRGWDNLIQARISVAVPLNENAQVATARLAVSSQPGSPALMSVASAMSRYLAIENVTGEQERIDSEQVAQGTIDGLVTFAQERALGLTQGQGVPGDDLQARIGALPESFQAAVQQYAGRLGQPLPAISNNQRGAANQVRTGVQTPSNTEATRLAAQAV